MIRLPAYAKINLSLEVLGRRQDGYHEIRSVAQTIRLHDALTLERADRWEVRMVGPETAPAVTSGSTIKPQANLITRAGRALEQALGRELPTLIRCDKRIPIAAGLGGGSSDAATTLLGLRALWDLALRPRELMAIAATLGSDVPFLLRGGTALLAGRGVLVTSAPPIPRCWIVLAVPRHATAEKTALMYGRLTPRQHSDGQRSAALLRALERGVEAVAAARWNVFESVAEDVFPGLGALRRRASAATGLDFRLSGAGPALYAMVPSRDGAQSAMSRLQGLDATLIATTVVRSGPRQRVRHLREGFE